MYVNLLIVNEIFFKGILPLFLQGSLLRKRTMADRYPQVNSCQSSSTPPVNSSREVIKDEDSLVQRLQALYNSELFSDIVLRIGDYRYHAHKFMLITSSEVFE